MPQHIAFLRAINVGGHTVKMDHLRRLFEEAGFSGVETFIASGNVIFESRLAAGRPLERRIESHLREALGYEVATFIRSPAELGTVAKYKPFAAAELNAEGNVLYIGFLLDEPSAAAKKKLLALAGDVDSFHISGREFYWLCRKKMSESRFSGAVLEKTLEMPATLRNSTTVRKMAALYG